MLHTVAIAPSGEVVGYNDLVVSADDPDEVMQWGTLVRREHRGHRLGMAVKVCGLQELALFAPQAKRIQTCNAEQNAHMVGFNVELGFRANGAVEAALAPLAGIRELVVEGTSLRARADEGARAVPLVLGALEAGGVEVASVTVARRTPRLRARRSCVIGSSSRSVRSCAVSSQRARRCSKG